MCLGRPRWRVAACTPLAGISRGTGFGPADGLFGFDRNAPLTSLARCRPSLGRAVVEAQHESPVSLAVRDQERHKHPIDGLCAGASR